MGCGAGKSKSPAAVAPEQTNDLQPVVPLPSKSDSQGTQSSGHERVVFVSFSHQLRSSEEQAVWIQDTCRAAKLAVATATDASTGQEHERAKVRILVQTACAFVCVLDPYSFEKPEVAEEATWAHASGVPITLVYDGDRHSWQQITKWAMKYAFAFQGEHVRCCKAQLEEAKDSLLKAVARDIPKESPSPCNSVAPQTGSSISARLPPGMKYHFFLSHSQATGGDQADALCLELHCLGLKAWYDNRAANVTEEGMVSGVNEAHAFVLFLSEGCLLRPFVQVEIRAAVAAKKTILLIHEADTRHHPFNFATEVQEAPEDLQPLISSRESMPWRRKAYERKALIQQLMEKAGLSMPTMTSIETDAMTAAIDEVRAKTGQEKLTKAASPVCVAVGFSSSDNSTTATVAAYKQLQAKLNGSLSFALVATSSRHDLSAIAKKLSEILPKGTPFMGTTSFGGVVVDADWMSKRGMYLALMGISDPEGIYEVCHADYTECPYGDTKATNKDGQSLITTLMNGGNRADFYDAHSPKVKEDVVAAARAGMARVRKRHPGQPVDAPQFVTSFFYAGLESPAIAGLQAEFGDDIPIIGSGCMPCEFEDFFNEQVQYPMGLICSGGRASQPVVCRSGGFSFTLCWPSVAVIGAFCSGLVPNPMHTGKVTKIDGPLIVEEIDGKPAADVLCEWIPATKALLEKNGNKGDIIKPIATGDMELIEQNTLNPLGVVVGVDEDGTEFHTPAYVTTIQLGGFIQMGSVAMDVGTDLVPMKATKADLRDRTVKVAKQTLRSSKLETEEIRGMLSIMCAINRMMAGDDGMQTLADSLGRAVDYVPSLGICGGPEIGQCGCSKANSANYMFSSIFFTGRRLQATLTPRRQAHMLSSKSSKLLSNTGSTLELAEKDE